MSTVLQSEADKNVLTEVYELVKTAEVVLNRIYCRVEILKLYHPKDSDLASNTDFIARYYMLETVTAQPTYPQQDGQFEREPERMEIWKHIPGMPWVNQHSPELALAQALQFLQDPR